MKKFKFVCEIIVEANNPLSAKEILHNDVQDMVKNSGDFCMCINFVLEPEKRGKKK